MTVTDRRTPTSSASSTSSTSSSRSSRPTARRPQGVPRRAVRPRARLGALPRGQRRPRPAARSCRRRSTSASSPPAARTRTTATRSATACAARRSSTWGSDEQKQRYLRPLFTGEEIWCQLFSEPGAGSDFAGLSSTRRARRRRVDRQRPEGVDHARPPVAVGPARRAHRPRRAQARGLTAFVVDMHAPGVEVRPLRQMTGEAEFNEVYFTDARIPDAERLGEPGRRLAGVAHHAHERAGVDRRRHRRRGARARSPRPCEIWQTLPAERKDAAAARRADEALDRGRGQPAHQHPGRRRTARSATPGPEGSIGKLAFAEPNKASTTFCVDLLGADGMLYGSYEMVRPETAMGSDTRAEGVPAQPGQLDRGRHVRGHAEHPRRAGARPARRRPRRPRGPLEGRPPQLTRGCAA